MGAFELNIREDIRNTSSSYFNTRRLREECIIALKVYDSCRSQDCLNIDIIGPARAANCVTIEGEHIKEGEIILPPSSAASVTIDSLCVKKILIVGKQANPFKSGFWDIDLKYVFEYRLTFRESDGSIIIPSVYANSIFHKKVSLFGSTGNNLLISTDLLRQYGEYTGLDSDPFVMVEAKGVSLYSELRFYRTATSRGEISEPSEVAVTIGLFTIIKLFRIVTLGVESRGFYVPNECEESEFERPCDFFDSLEFPMDSFAPPQREDFLESSRLIRDNRNNRGFYGRN